MVTVTINDAGRLKRDVIEIALEFCGTAGYEFEHTPEEVGSTLRLLDTMMAEWPWSELGYNAATYGAGLPEDHSGLAEEDVAAVAMHLALRRAPGMGANLSQQAAASIARTYSAVTSRVATIPSALIAPSTVRGAGARYRIPFINETPED